MILLPLLLGVTLFLFLKSTYRLFVLVPSAKSMKRVLEISKIGSREKDIIDYIIEYLSRAFEKFSLFAGWSLSQEKREELANTLKRAGLNDSVERFYAKKFIYPASALIVGFLISSLFQQVPLTAYIFKGTSVFIAIVLYFYPSSQLKKQIALKNERLILEMPRFIRTIRYSPQNKALLHIILDYLKCAKSGLKFDLTQLAADIQVCGETKALESFMTRVNIPEIREFVTVVLLSLGNKENVDMNLYFIESKFEEKVSRIIDKELKKRPEILDTINEGLLYSLGLIFIIPMLIYSWEGISQMFK